MERGQFANVLGTPELDYISLREDWFSILDRAQTLVDSLPAAEIGCLYLDSGEKLVDPRVHSQSIRHFGSVGGAWPRLADNPSNMDPRRMQEASRAILEQSLEKFQAECDGLVGYNDVAKLLAILPGQCEHHLA